MACNQINATGQTMPAPTSSLLRDIWREDVDDTVWAQWGDSFCVNVSPDDYGYRATLIFPRKVDGTYWAVDYLEGGAGDYNSFRDEDPKYTTVFQVWPHVVSSITYRLTAPNSMTKDI